MPAVTTVLRNPVAARNRIGRIRRTITFDGLTGSGATGVHTLFTAVGPVALKRLIPICKTSLVSAGGGTLQLGSAAFPAAIINTTTAADLATNEPWLTTTATATIFPIHSAASIFAGTQLLLNTTLILSVGTAAVTSGVLSFDCWWKPLAPGARLS